MRNILRVKCNKNDKTITMSIYKITDGRLEEENKEAISMLLESELENIIWNTLASEDYDSDDTIASKIFSENGLYLLNKQQIFKEKSKSSKRSDIVGIDKDGRIVIIELKKDTGRLGVEMEALQYLLKINAQPKGMDFLRNNNKLKFTNEYGLEILEVKHKEEKINKLLQFINDKDNINKKQRIILIAKGFEESIYSMGEWLSEKGVGFTCISYDVYKFNAQDFISFSVKFDSKPYNSYQLMEKNRGVNKSTVPYYYHNSGSENRNHWNETLIERALLLVVLMAKKEIKAGKF